MFTAWGRMNSNQAMKNMNNALKLSLQCSVIRCVNTSVIGLFSLFCKKMQYTIKLEMSNMALYSYQDLFHAISQYTTYITIFLNGFS